MLQVQYEADGRQQTFNLSGDEATIGRATDNDIVLNDFSVSRRHAYLRRENEVWVLRDNHSTNGVRVNDQPVPESPVADGDSATIGTFRLLFRELVARETSAALDSTSTCIRPISEFNLDFGLEPDSVAIPETTENRKRAALDVVYKTKVFEILVQVAKTLISADDVETVLGTVMNLIFEYLPVDRGFLLLEERGNLELRVSRYKSQHRGTSDGSAPYSCGRRGSSEIKSPACASSLLPSQCTNPLPSSTHMSR